MVYGGLMLALHVDLQDRMIEEVDRNFREAAKQGRQELDYDIDYPKFQYTLAFMVSFSNISFRPRNSILTTTSMKSYACFHRSRT